MFARGQVSTWVTRGVPAAATIGGLNVSLFKEVFGCCDRFWEQEENIKAIAIPKKEPNNLCVIMITG